MAAPAPASAATPLPARSERIGTKILITLLALGLVALQLLKLADINATALGLIALAVLPWLSSILDTAELPGGWKMKFREVEHEQQRLDREIQWLKFLTRNFLTGYEVEHLQKFAADGSFWFEFDSGTKTYFERELRRMLDLNLVERLPGTGVGALLHNRDGVVNKNGKDMKDVKQYLRITEQGREYLKMRGQLAEGAAPPAE
jgi:hypothetical protein